MQYLKISLTGQAKAAISGFGLRGILSAQRHIIKPGTFSARSLADRESLLNLNLRRYTHIFPVRHDDSNSIVRFSNVVKNTVNVLTRLGFQPDLELEGVLSSATK